MLVAFQAGRMLIAGTLAAITWPSVSVTVAAVKPAVVALTVTGAGQALVSTASMSVQVKVTVAGELYWPGGDAEPVTVAVIVTPRSALVSPVQSTVAVRSQCGLPDASTSSPSSDQNAVFSPFTHSLAGWTVKPSLLRLSTAPLGRWYAAAIWNVPLFASPLV